MAKKSNVAIWSVLAILAVVVILFTTGVIQTAVQTGGDNTVIQTCPDSTGILTLGATDASGASVSSPTITCGVNGGAVTSAVTSGTTSFAVGSQLDCLVSKSGYIDTEYQKKMACGGIVDSISVELSGATNPTITIKDPANQGATVTDNVAGGAVNLTAPTAGATLKFDVDFQGVSQESSGDGVYVVELPSGSDSNISKGNQYVTFGDASHTTVPSVHSTTGANARVDAFAIPAIVGAKDPSYRYVAQLKASDALTGGVLTDWYASQAFVDTDNQISVGVENTDGTAKYENTQDYDFLIV